MRHPGLKLLIVPALLGAMLAAPLGCSLYRNDKCWVPPQQYEEARALYLQTGSLDLVARRMEDLQWRRCRRNEVLYRLGKEFEVLPEEVPAAAVMDEGDAADPAAEPPQGGVR